jgi:hypothetical protein
MERDVHLTIDEVGLIGALAKYALERLGSPAVFPDGALLRSVIEMNYANSAVMGIGRMLPQGRSISRDDLAFLAPYIDEWIEGKAPTQNLPAEYYDWRPDALRSFKERMVAEKLWPSAKPALPSG